jgi:hypothetical protein
MSPFTYIMQLRTSSSVAGLIVHIPGVFFACMYVYSNMPPNRISQWDDKASKGHVNAHLSFVPGITFFID